MSTLDLAFAPCPAVAPDLDAREAHVWQVNLDVARAPVLRLDEQARANAMRHMEKRAHFIAARTALRQIISLYMNVPPADIVLGTAAQGKPVLEGRHDLQFNLTHAQGRALIGIARVAVGIDLEFPRAVRQMDRLIADYFSPEEAREIADLPEHERAQAFLAAWTRKEACLKATGEGLAGGLHRYRVSLRPQEDARLMSIDGDEQQARAWTLHAFTSFPDAQAAICLAGTNFRLRGFML